MSVYFIIIAEFLFISVLILLLFKLRKKIGLAPLYIFLGSIQYLQTRIAASIQIKIFDSYSIYPGSVILFSSVLFAVLLVYIKEGVASTRSLIYGIVMANIALALLIGVTNYQQLLVAGGNPIQSGAADLFRLDYLLFAKGTVILVLDFFLLVIIYKALITKFKKVRLFSVILFSLLAVFCFDAVAFTTVGFYELPVYKNILISHLIGKSMAAFLYAMVLYVYIKFIDKAESKSLFIADQSKNLFSIFSFRKEYEEAKAGKEIAEDEKQKLDSLIETSNDFIGMATLEGRSIFLNKNGRKLVGLTADEDISGFNITQFFPEAYRDTIVKEQLPAIMKDGLWNGEVFMQHYKTGKQIPMMMSGFLIRDENTKEPIAIGNVASDISGRKKAEEELKKSEEKHRTLSESSPDYIMRYDREGRHLFMNKAALEISGYKESEIIGKTHLEAGFDPEQSSFWEEKINYVFETGQTVQEQFQWESVKGLIYLDWRLSAELDADGNVISALGVSRDMTKQKKAENAVIESEKYLENIINNIGDPVFVKDEQSKFLLANDAFCTVFNVVRADIIGKTMAEDILPIEMEVFLRIDKEVLATGIENINEEMLTIGGGVTQIISTKKTRFIDDWGNKFLIGTIRDITARKKAEEQIVKTSEELRLLMQHLQNVREDERKRIGREIHDDLGQQLTAIKMYTAWIDKRIPNEQQLIKEKLAGIIELLDGSNLAMRKILNELRIGILDNDGLIDGLKWLSQQFEDSTNTDLDFTTNLLKIKVNEQAAICVFRVLQESLNNIAKHAAAKKVMVDISIADGKLTMIIVDDGKGFEMDKLPTADSFGILGMKERVAAVKGEFNLVSAVGSGTSLTIAVPV